MPPRRRAPPGLQQPCTSIASLPDSVLGRIFAVVGRRAGNSITRVSHRWHRIFFSEPALWHQLALTADSLEHACDKRKAGQWFSCKAALLRRVGGFVQGLRYAELLKHEEQEDPQDFIDFTMLGEAAEHYWATGGWQLSRSVLAHLSPGTLQSLRLVLEGADAAAMKALRRFSSLTELSVKCLCDMDRCVTAVLPSLPQLQRLELIGRSLPAGLPAALRHLSNLTSLGCCSKEQLPGLSAVLALSTLRTLDAWAEERWDGTLQPDVQQMLARLPHLTSWAFESENKEDVRGILQVGSALLLDCCASGYNRANGTVDKLQLGLIHEMQSLQQLVAGLLPASTPPITLHSLSLVGCRLPLPVVQECSCLGLESLDLSQNKFKQLPSALAAATNLEMLSLESNPELALTQTDVDRTLLRLHRLRRLHLGVTRTEAHVLWHLFSKAPRLNPTSKYASAQEGLTSSGDSSSGGGAAGAPAGAAAGQTESVSLRPRSWAGRLFGGGAAEPEDEMQRGSTELGAVDSLRESSVVVRPVAPPLANAAVTPRLGAMVPAPSSAAAARLPADVATLPPQPPPQPVVVPPAPPTASPLAAALGAPAAAAQQQPAAWGQPQQPGLQAPSWGQHPPATGPAPQQPTAALPLWGQKVQQAAYRDPPPPAPQQPLPPGRYGWQRVNQSPVKPQPLPAATGDAAAATAAAMAGKAAAMAAADSWASSEGDPSAPPQLQQHAAEQRQPAAMQPPLAAAMARRGSSQQQLLTPREATTQEASESSPAKSVDASAFHLNAHAGTTAEQEEAAGQVVASHSQAGQRPSRTAALRQRHARQLRQQDRDQFGVPVASSSRPFSLWSSPQKIGEACTGLGVYFASVKQFIYVALLLSIFCIYPLVNNLSSQAWSESYTLVVNGAPQLSCSKGWDTSSWVTGSTAGSRCTSSRYNSPFDCPALCAWSDSRLGSDARNEQCAALLPPTLPTGASGNATCLLHPPCSPGGGGDAAAQDGPCYCCDLQLDPAALADGSGSSRSVGSVPAGQLWDFFLAQLAFLVWVLVLTRAQLHAVHAADARVITASDYTVLIEGVPAQLSAAELQEWCSHYGSVVGAFHIPDVGDTVRVAQRLQMLLVRRAEADAWLASDACSASAAWFNLWALGATSRLRMQRQLDDAGRELRCYERQELRPTGAVLALFEYAEHAANCIEDHHRPLPRRAADALLCGATATAPRMGSRRVRVRRAPEPSDILWQHTACTGSSAVTRRLASAGLTLLIIVAGAAVQYGLAVAGEQERKNRLSALYRYNSDVDGSLDFSSWAAFTASALEVTKLNAISILSGLAVVLVNWLVTVAVRKLAVVERWHSRTAAERAQLFKLSLAYLLNAFAVPLLAAYFAGSSSSWYSRGGLLESAFYMQVANALLPPLATLCDLEDLVYSQWISRSAKTQAMMNRLLQPPEFLLAEQYASALTTLGLALCWMPVLPISPLIAALGLFLGYWAEKVVALRRAAHPGNLRGKLVSSAALLIRLLPLVQLLLMRFLYFVDEGAMVPVFWTGLAVWLLFAIAPLRSLLGLVARRRSTVTGGLSYQETLGSGQRQGLDDAYAAQLPPCASPEYQQRAAAAFALLPSPHPATEALLPRQRTVTGGAATRPPFRPDKEADRAFSRAAASVHLRQQAALNADMAAGAAGTAAAGAAAVGSPGAPGAGRRHVTIQLPSAPGSARPAVQSPGERLVRGLSAVKGSITEGASWFWNGPPNPEERSLFTYDWRRAGDEGASRAPEGPASARSSLTSGTSVTGPAATYSSAGTYGVPQVPPPGASPFQPLGRAASGQYTARTWGGSDAGA
ncbi:kinase domain [Chlorella sorokiniana]|uniref:Kinase domain n=1 Tax=Chlorella sorokiniana TaxID=3076 RepID=A0A2P6TIT3_CHLSO|nr:kinase domain [Chlorella sorokiniana]|eukprot:PRW39140.1 kinase domain [Chlorella sorokiniana]